MQDCPQPMHAIEVLSPEEEEQLAAEGMKLMDELLIAEENQERKLEHLKDAKENNAAVIQDMKDLKKDYPEKYEAQNFVINKLLKLHDDNLVAAEKLAAEANRKIAEIKQNLKDIQEQLSPGKFQDIIEFHKLKRLQREQKFQKILAKIKTLPHCKNNNKGFAERLTMQAEQRKPATKAAEQPVAPSALIEQQAAQQQALLEQQAAQQQALLEQQKAQQQALLAQQAAQQQALLEQKSAGQGNLSPIGDIRDAGND